MFNVTIKEKEYKVKFDHRRGYSVLKDSTRCTIDNIVKKRYEYRVSYGKAYLHPKDNYDKNFGRKLSLARALKNGGFNTKERTLFWEAYFKTRGKVN